MDARPPAFDFWVLFLPSSLTVVLAWDVGDEDRGSDFHSSDNSVWSSNHLAMLRDTLSTDTADIVE